MWCHTVCYVRVNFSEPAAFIFRIERRIQNVINFNMEVVDSSKKSGVYIYQTAWHHITVEISS
jgi:hypothetical protein